MADGDPEPEAATRPHHLPGRIIPVVNNAVVSPVTSSVREILNCRLSAAHRDLLIRRLRLPARSAPCSSAPRALSPGPEPSRGPEWGPSECRGLSAAIPGSVAQMRHLDQAGADFCRGVDRGPLARHRGPSKTPKCQSLLASPRCTSRKPRPQFAVGPATSTPAFVIERIRRRDTGSTGGWSSAWVRTLDLVRAHDECATSGRTVA